VAWFPLLRGAQLAEQDAEHNCPIGRRHSMNNVIYIVGLIVVVIAVLSFFGLR
jgi:hypothetical protein